MFKNQEKKNEQEDNIWAKSQKTAEAYSSFKDPKAAIQAAKEIRQKTGETDDKKIKDALKMTKEFGSGNLTFNEAKGLPLLSQQIPDEIYSAFILKKIERLF